MKDASPYLETDYTCQSCHQGNLWLDEEDEYFCPVCGYAPTQTYSDGEIRFN